MLSSGGRSTTAVSHPSLVLKAKGSGFVEGCKVGGGLAAAIVVFNGS